MSPPTSSSPSLRSNLMELYKNIVANNNTIKSLSKTMIETATTTTTTTRTSSSFILRNPQTLISHDPTQLSQSLDLTLDQIASLRTQISNSIVSDSIVGNCMNENSIVSSEEGQQQEENETNDNSCSDRIFSGKKRSITTIMKQQQQQQYPSKRKNQLILSSMTAKDSYTIAKHNSMLIHTGSQALDKLLSSSPSSSSLETNKIINTQQHIHNNRIHDNMIAGSFGIQIGTITEICGLSSSGKTQLVLFIAANSIISHYLHSNQISCYNNHTSRLQLQQKYPKFRVYYIASGGGNTSLLSLAKRFRQLCREQLKNTNNVNSFIHNHNTNTNTSSSTTTTTTTTTTTSIMNNDNDVLLDQIIFTSVSNNPYYLLAELHKIEHDFLMVEEGEHEEHDKSNILIIIDSIAGCLSSYLYSDGDSGIGAGLMNEISLCLRRMSRMKVKMKNSNIIHQCAVLVTNNMVVDYNSNHDTYDYGCNSSGYNKKNRRMYKPALGDSWRACDVRLILERVEDVYDVHDMNDHNGEKNNKSACTSSTKGLAISTKMIVNARLDKHFTRGSTHSRQILKNNMVRIAIDGSGVMDAN